MGCRSDWLDARSDSWTWSNLVLVLVLGLARRALAFAVRRQDVG